MSGSTIFLNDSLYQYFLENSLNENSILKKLREQTQKMSMSQMQISPEQGQFTQLLIRLMGAKRALEIGVFTGYSTLCVALALPAHGQIIACDRNQEWTKIAQKFWNLAGVQNKIDLRLGDAKETLETLLEKENAGTFDFVFIDADKINYDYYYEKALILLRTGGLIMIDNVLWDGDVINLTKQDQDTNAIRALNKKLASDSRIFLSMLPLGDGITLAQKL